MDSSALEAEPLLSPAEEVRLALEIEAGVLAADALGQGSRPFAATVDELVQLVAIGHRARQRYIQANLRLVAMVVRSAGGRTAALDGDLFQEGCLGLMTAVDRFDVRRGCRFATYALLWIRACVGAASAQRLATSNLPASRAIQLRQARGVETILAQELGRQPSAAEVAAVLGRSPDWTTRLLSHERTQALEDVGDLGSEDRDLVEVVTGADTAAELLGTLAGFDRRVLELLLGFEAEPMSYADVARTLRVTSNRVRRAERRALERLREVCPQAARNQLAG